MKLYGGFNWFLKSKEENEEKENQFLQPAIRV